jgi:tRNA-splicing ligase RtcB (3'-phosphate/5'-hydroxy nucleic acid ligase)
MPITGKTLIALGYKPGPWFPEGIAAAQRASQEGADEAGIRAAIDDVAPRPAPRRPLRASGTVGFHMNIRAEDAAEAENIASVEHHMTELMRVPTIRAGAVMPDACPAGTAPGTIPVGGIVAAEEAIHPGMHSADICCSMAVSVFSSADPTGIIDAGMKISHFGGGGRAPCEDMRPSAALLEEFEGNRLLKAATEAATAHFGTQGDGNHFFYVGRLASSGDIALVTHHGSRKPGALLYKLGMDIAERYRRDLSPETKPHNAWIPSETDDGRDYWDALQVIRKWTKDNHFAIHDAVAKHLALKVKDRFWNEHNFVFRKPDGLFYHAKGATPAFANYAADASGLTLIPLNMAEPILITRGLDAGNGLGFAPHGAGRNFSRTAFMKQYAHMTVAQIVAEQTRGIDARYFCGIPDVSELPGAYKNAATVRRQIGEYGLAEVVDTIEPVGNIMAGDWQQQAPWRTKRAGKRT